MWTKKVLGPDGRACGIIELLPDGSAMGCVFPEGEPADWEARLEPTEDNGGRLIESEKLVTLVAFIEEELSVVGAGAD
ncbi:MAG TPA: hypothetical protein VN282_19785 [Pyrinomonadaceae bacterium]|nr:hypothetical protein [Pyrinomonadaceae bacterium]